MHMDELLRNFGRDDILFTRQNIWKTKT
jgi:hypothetical protein